MSANFEHVQSAVFILGISQFWAFNSGQSQFWAFHKYAEHGLRILAFPCNQFGGQEPGTNEEIKEFVKGYDVQFDMFSKIDVNGSNADPLYVFLKNAKHGTLTNSIKWNFTKFLCDKHGVPVKRYSSTVSPLDIEKDIEKELSKD
ncbi:Phospholipid hydroperoxide glutathione peroxidase, mitochondrial [Desmophyllum pertusum]|uniref:Glutathione peroxidase n=1 Tax=Desmophyllum pertusum TaxID=174260 RepID=A0A9W9Y9V2_9CNID|nr:Phospholipid hydroperoxide glutathione peroxidase, mitochondrial [Desmophyllum pertusum]